MPEYVEYTGKFLCQECGTGVTKARFWKDGNMTWRCHKGHTSTVTLKKPTKAERKAKYAGG